MAPKAAAAPPQSMDISDFLGEAPSMECPTFIGGVPQSFSKQGSGSFTGSSAPSPALEKEMATSRKLREELVQERKARAAPTGRGGAGGGGGAELKKAQDDCKELRAQLEEGQRALEATSRAANEALKDMRTTEARAVEQATERSEEMMAEVQAAAAQLERFTRPQRARCERLRQRLEEKNTLRGGAKRALSKKFAVELAQATKGNVVDKIDQRKGGKQVRLMVIDVEEGLLRWGAPPGPLAHNCTCLSLDQVLRLEYGRGSRAWALYPNEMQWLCFSLYTTDRSFDYICKDDKAVQSFMVSISLCFPRIVGAFSSRSHFISFRGWVKVQDTCMKKNMTPANGLLQALLKAGHVFRVTGKRPGKGKKPGQVGFASVDEDEEEDELGSSMGSNPFTFVKSGTMVSKAANPFTFVATKSGGGAANPFTFVG